MPYHAVDFGTSNSLLNFVSESGKITSVPLDINSNVVLRSLLYTPTKNTWYFGNEAINEYVSHEGEGRFFRSIKKFLPEQSYTGTSVFNKNMNISEMVSVFLNAMRLKANAFTGVSVESIVLGRPALYSMDKDLDKLAQDRMHTAALMAGYKEVIFCPEPIAAGLDYSSVEGKERIVLIADFGGGTSDFTLMKFHGGKYSQEDILGLSGIFMAGDVLDGVMMRDFISPHFGSKFEYTLPGSQNVLKFPKNLLTKICSPAHITHLKEKDTWEFLQHINKFALDEQDKIRMDNLLTLVECQLGFPLFHEIEKTKIHLSKSSQSSLHYHFLNIDISENVSALEYETSLTSTISDIMASMMDVFTQSGLTPGDVDQVCLTGGTSQMPLIRNKLAEIFGQDKMSEYSVYQSVVSGLARYASTLG